METIRKHWAPSLAFAFLAVLFAIAKAGVCAGPAAIGFVAGTGGATSATARVRANTALFSGDILEAHGVTVISLKSGSRVVLASQTLASFHENANDFRVALERGSLSLFRPEGGATVSVEAGGVSITPVGKSKTLADVAALRGELTIRANEGALRVAGGGVDMQAAKGKTLRLTVKQARAPQAQAAGAGAAAAGGHAASAAPGALTLAGAGVAVASDDKNPIAIEHVGEHVPPPACRHAASESVPAAACPDFE